MTPIKTKILAVLNNDIFWIFFISILAAVFGKLSEILNSEFLYWIHIGLCIIAAAYFFAWCIISVIKQSNKKK